MISKTVGALIALVLLGAAGLAVQPVLAQSQTANLEQRVKSLEERIARLEELASPRVRPAS